MKKEKKKFPRSRSDIAIREIFRSGATWEDLERLFDVNQKQLRKEIREYLLETKNPDERLSLIEKQIKANEEKREEGERNL